MSLYKNCTTVNSKRCEQPIGRNLKPIVCSGKIYSEEHKRKFDIKSGAFKVENDQSDSGKLVLTINRQVISDWFREQFDRIHKKILNSA